MMKVKFYKGPYHNKTREVADHTYDLVVGSTSPKKVLASPWFDPTAEIIIYKHRYVKTRHTHPDGSVFFVYQGKS